MSVIYMGAILIFVFGVPGVILNRNSIIIMLMSMELMFLGVVLLMIQISSAFDDMTGVIWAIAIITVVAADSAIGLSMLVAFYVTRGSINVKSLNVLRG